MRTTVRNLAKVVLLLGAAACSSQPSRAPGPGGGRATAMATGSGVARSGGAVALLGDGRVLVAGGLSGGSATRSAQLFDPGSGAFTDTGPLATARAHATATVLLDGRVLVAGGDDGAGTSLATAELYDPAAGTFSSGGAFPAPGDARAWHTATRLPGGRVLVLGGRADGSSVLASALEYTPAAGAAGSWAASSFALGTARARHTATLLGDGTVLVAGGEDGSGAPIVQALAAEVFDPAAGATATSGTMTARTRHTATRLPDGDVLVVGGWDGAAELASAELYRPATGDFAAGPALGVARADATSTLLPDGRVVVAGGEAGGSALNDVDVYAAGAASAAPVGRLAAVRAGHAATLLPSGRILLTGGGLGSAELLDRAQDQWTALDPSGYVPSHGHTATLLVNGPDAGKLLVVGGIDPYGGYLQSAQLFDPGTGSLTSLPTMGSARAYHTATLLPTGDVLVAGGKSGATSTRNTAMIYRAASRTWSTVAGTMSVARSSHTATLLGNGQVLIAGGDDGTTALASGELYNFATDQFIPVGNAMSAGRTHHAAALMRSWNVLLAGGDGTSTADVYDFGNNAFVPVGSMATVRSHATATPLPDGRVLVAGGRDGTAELGTAEVFDGAAFTGTPGTLTPRYDHAAAALPSGEVIVAGGQDASGFLALVERYEPASGRFVQTGIAPLDQERDLFSATLLPSGQLLAWGGLNGSSSHAMPDVYDAFDALASPPPDLAGSMPLPSRSPGVTFTLSPAGGASFVGPDTGSGDTRASAADGPVFVLTREDGDGIAFARTVSFAPGSAQVRLPDTLVPGWWWIRAVVGGAPGKGLPIYVLWPFVISPTEPTVPPRGSIAFTASGGSFSGYVWSIVQAGSAHAETPGQPSVDATGVYVAGATGDSVDVVQVVDSTGNAVTTQVHVGPGVSIVGSGPVAPLGSIAFSATGGSGAGYVWSFQPGGNLSGGSLDPSTGAYVAGPTGGALDAITVVDSLGNHAELTIEVTTPIAITPTTVSTTPLGTAAFTVSGGYEAGGYTWSISTNASGGTVDGSGNYQAGRTGSVTDVVRVSDALGSYAEATVTVGPAVSISPAAPTTPPRGSVSFTAAGGTDTGFTWSLATNASGGTIDPATGAYTAGATPSVTDVVQVQDSVGNVATVAVEVGPGVSITPRDPGAYPGQTVTLHAQGGSGTGFTWAMVTVNSGGGTVDPATGVYTAGTVRGALDVVQVTDSLGNTATIDVAVWPDWKPSGSGCSSLGGGTGVLGLFLLALWLALRGLPRRSRRQLGAGGRAGIALALVVGLGAGAARAQTPTVSRSFVVERFQPTGGAYDLLGIESAQVPGHLAFTARGYLNYASRPLILKAPGMEKVALLRSQTALDLSVAVGILDWAEVSAVLSGMVSQGREQNRLLPPAFRDIPGSGLSDARIVPKVRLLEWRKLRLGAAAPIGIPIGNKDAFLGHGGPTVNPTALLEVDALGPARVLLQGGAVLRQERRLVDLTVGNAYTYGAGVEYPFLAGGQRLSALSTFQGEAGMKGGAAARPMELLGGMRWTSPGGLLVTLGGGPGIGKGYGTPQYRVFAEVGFTTSGLDRLGEKERPEPAKPEEPAVEEPKPEEPKPAEPAAEPEKPAEPPAATAEEPPPEEPEPTKYEPLPEPKVQPDGSLRIDARVYFDFNKKAIKPEFRPMLRHVAKRILGEPRMRVVRIEGHADDLGPPEYNLWLSEERSRAVKDYLIKCGVPASRIVVVGFGKTHPAQPGRGVAERAKNRRVEFNVQEQ